MKISPNLYGRMDGLMFSLVSRKFLAMCNITLYSVWFSCDCVYCKIENLSNIDEINPYTFLNLTHLYIQSSYIFNILTSESCKMLRSSECKSWNPSFIPRGSFRKHVTWSQHWHTKPWHWWILRWQIWGLWMFA